jgi:hypothetical protein
MTKITIEVDEEQVTSLVRKDLLYAYTCLQEDLDNRLDPESKRQLCIFFHDQETDVKEIKRHIKAFKCVLLYYGVYT